MTTKINLPFLNFNHIEDNIEDVYNFASQELNLDLANDVDTKTKYFKSINKIQSTEVPYNKEKINVTFFDKILQDKLLELGMIDKNDLENNNHIYSDEEQKVIRYRLEKALELIKMLHPDLHKLINTLVGTFLILKKDLFGGGSVSNVMGLIWLNPQKDWSIIQYAESVYHEFIHQSIFLDDMVNSMFPDANACATEDALVTSTVLKIKRPLDRSYHAAGVSIGIMHLYYLFNDINNSTLYMKDLQVTLNEINERTKYLGEQGIYTLDIMNSFVKEPNFEDITKSLYKTVS
ncbi:aKG-HExxH-type peptide beta-hydroxylase [Staphylococcus felis]|nr:HEXXH motif-containing putative peptide modification protein [Staphylococcus felis]